MPRLGDSLILGPEFNPCCRYTCFYQAIVNLYYTSSVQDQKDYSLDGTIDLYAFYFACAYVIEGVALSLQIKNMCKEFLSKVQVIILAVIVGVFQMASLMIFGITSAYLFTEDWVFGEDLCKLENCDAHNTLKWEFFGYFVVNLVSMLVQICYLKQVTIKYEAYEQRDTLITSEDLNS